MTSVQEAGYTITDADVTREKVERSLQFYWKELPWKPEATYSSFEKLVFISLKVKLRLQDDVDAEL
jgi:hypothetical protein